MALAGSWIYLRKKTNQGPFDLFSDRASRLKHLNRILNFLGIFALIELGFGVLAAVTAPKVSVYSIILILIGLLFSYGYSVVYRKKQQLMVDSQLYE